MRFYALLASMLLGWTFSADGQDLAGSKQTLDSMPRAVTSTATPRWRAQVVAWYPHDVWAFTEGLLLHKGKLYESTGLKGASSLRRVRVETGLVTRAIQMHQRDFGEGLSVKGDRLVQLTYQQHIALIYDLASFKRIGQFRFSGEGWGLCFDGRRFVMSNGTDKLTLRDARTFAVQSTVPVTLDGKPQNYLNELECVGDLVYANVFHTDSILEIGRDGIVRKIIDLADLLTQQERDRLGEGIPKGQENAGLNGMTRRTAPSSSRASCGRKCSECVLCRNGRGEPLSYCRSTPAKAGSMPPDHARKRWDVIAASLEKSLNGKVQSHYVPMGATTR